MKNELRELWEQKIEFYNLMSMVFMKEPGEDFCNVLWQMLKEDYFPLAENRPDIHTFHEQLRKHLSETTSADFAKVSDNHLPGDHISIELDFLKRLSEKELNFIDTDKLNENTAVFSDNLEFVKKYLLDWIDDFMKNLSLSGSIYYLLFASMAKAAGELDRKVLQNLLKKEKKEEEN